jgi:hypothetical protein
MVRSLGKKSMPEPFETTFNYLLSHKVIPKMYFDDLDYFHKEIIPETDVFLKFLDEAVEKAAKIAEENPQIEGAYPIDVFEFHCAGLEDEDMFSVIIPNAEKMCDSVLIAFPFGRQYASYFTCELSLDFMTNETFFIMGEWQQKEDGAFIHINHGRLENANPENFMEQCKKIVFGKNAANKEG